MSYGINPPKGVAFLRTLVSSIKNIEREAILLIGELEQDNVRRNTETDRELHGSYQSQEPRRPCLSEYVGAYGNTYKCGKPSGHGGTHAPYPIGSPIWTDAMEKNNKNAPKTCGNTFTNCAGDTYSCSRPKGHAGHHAAKTELGFETQWPQGYGEKPAFQCTDTMSVEACGEARFYRCTKPHGHEVPHENRKSSGLIFNW
jgi:hypothetical protein